jgi:hypothetical protein
MANGLFSGGGGGIDWGALLTLIGIGYSVRETRKATKKAEKKAQQDLLALSSDPKDLRQPLDEAPQAVDEARQRAVRRASRRRGLGSTNVTGGLGLTDQATLNRKTLLGQ